MESSLIKRERTGFGTREWSEFSYNICLGCSHNCRYCYARARALRNNLIATPEEWAIERVDMNKVNATHNRRTNGLTMFPSSHDITPAILDPCMATIDAMLKADNNLLIVSKPHLECVQAMCERFADYKGKLLFRFTIGSLDDSRTSFLEPGAPPPAERLECLKLACRSGYKTSVSMEPMLEDEIGTMEVIRSVYPFVSEDIWIGTMNSLRSRFVGNAQEAAETIRYFNHANSPEAVMALHQRFKDNSKIKWKESISRMLSEKLRNDEMAQREKEWNACDWDALAE